MQKLHQSTVTWVKLKEVLRVVVDKLQTCENKVKLGLREDIIRNN